MSYQMTKSLLTVDDPRSHLVMAVMICQGYLRDNRKKLYADPLFVSDIKRAESCADKFLKNKEIAPELELALVTSLSAYAIKIKQVKGLSEENTDKKKLLELLKGMIPRKPSLEKRIKQWKEIEIKDKETKGADVFRRKNNE